MLALSRTEGQSIIIDGRIEVKIVKWSRSSVRLAIQAPREVAVDRDEIWRKMHPGEKTPLELAEVERAARFAAQGNPAPVKGEFVKNMEIQDGAVRKAAVEVKINGASQTLPLLGVIRNNIWVPDSRLLALVSKVKEGTPVELTMMKNGDDTVLKDVRVLPGENPG